MDFRQKSHVDPVNNYQARSSYVSLAADESFFFFFSSRNARMDTRSFFTSNRAGNSHVQIRETNTDIGRYVRFIASEKEQRAHGCHGSVFALHALIWSIIPNSARTGQVGVAAAAAAARDRDRSPPSSFPPPPRPPIYILLSADAKISYGRIFFNGRDINMLLKKKGQKGMRHFAKHWYVRRLASLNNHWANISSVLSRAMQDVRVWFHQR